MNNEERNEKRNNSQGIFYVVIGVATLVVTIVGATFAFFSATAGSANNAVTAGSTNVQLGFNENAAGLRSDLIPMNEALWTNSNIGTYVGISDQTTTKCVDTNSNSICSVYEFTITNDNAAAQTLYPTFSVGTNGFTNLKYAVFMGPASSITLPASSNLSTATGNSAVSSGTYDSATATKAANGTLIIPATTVPAAGNSHTANGSGDTLDNMRITLPGNGGTVTYTMVIWLHETGYNQSAATASGNETDEAGKSFAGTITFNTAGGSSTGITGRISA